MKRKPRRHPRSQVTRTAIRKTQRRRRRPSTREDRAQAKPTARTLAKVAEVVSRMRQGFSFASALKEVRVSRDTVLKLGGSSLRRMRNGRYVAMRTDRLVRVVRIPLADGLQDIAIRGSGQASTVGEYWNAVHTYLATGDSPVLERFVDVHITSVDGTEFPLMTDPAALDRLGNAGVLSFESIYAKVG